MAQALEIVGDRWTLLIIRDLLTGTTHFNALRRGLPGISRTLLATRLGRLQRAGVVEKCTDSAHPRVTEYRLTQAGQDLQAIIAALLVWGAKWSFGEPSPNMLDPLLLMWWMHDRVNRDRLPEGRTVVQFDFSGAKSATYWQVLTQRDVTLCVTDPGYAIDLWVIADLATAFKLWLGRSEYAEAIASGLLHVEGIPRLVQAFPSWFAWSPAAEAVRATLSHRAV